MELSSSHSHTRATSKGDHSMPNPTYRYNDFELNNLIVRHVTSKGVSMPLRHLHSQYEFVFIKSGKVTVESNTSVLNVEKPTLIVHKPFSLHRANADVTSLYDRYLIVISDELLESIRDLIPFFSFFSTAETTVIPLEGDVVASVFEQLEQLSQDYRNEKKHKALLKTALLLLSVTEYASETGIPLPTSSGYIGEVIKYISTHYAEDLTIDMLADTFFVSRSKLISDFKKSIGVPIKKYTVFVRISNAQHFLNSGKTISETAALCGFYDNSHFISTFHILTGKTPKEYCKLRQKKNTI